MDKSDIVDIITHLLGVRKVRAESTFEDVRRKNPSEEKKYKSGFFTRQKYNEPFTHLKGGRVFISEYDLKGMLRENSNEITIPKNAIISPLAAEIILEKNIEVKRI